MSEAVQLESVPNGAELRSGQRRHVGSTRALEVTGNLLKSIEGKIARVVLRDLDRADAGATGKGTRIARVLNLDGLSRVADCCAR